MEIRNPSEVTGAPIDVWCTHVQQCGYVCYVWKIGHTWKTQWVKVE